MLNVNSNIKITASFRGNAGAAVSWTKPADSGSFADDTAAAAMARLYQLMGDPPVVKMTAAEGNLVRIARLYVYNASAGSSALSLQFCEMVSQLNSGRTITLETPDGAVRADIGMADTDEAPAREAEEETVDADVKAMADGSRPPQPKATALITETEGIWKTN